MNLQLSIVFMMFMWWPLLCEILMLPKYLLKCLYEVDRRIVRCYYEILITYKLMPYKCLIKCLCELTSEGMTCYYVFPIHVQVNALQVFDEMSLWMNYDQVNIVVLFKMMLCFTFHAIESWGYLILDNLAIYLEPVSVTK